ncbi:DNA polymerase-3 subunit gamma/tau [Nonomuraea thailandensis]|uniref:DNA polymerase III subunit gamma/tau n=1 Tax=Nonomuraea thailandensis TaxID=1188745 RepID=A0A9X2K884_9ACTN|nr:DNA polymerase III subunit gamma and tau [Nonomuraea thailandensis]MCP2363370.1 DNA polymerase-3 subunit gamma/tau [Nonomuraea thailandensis]
MSLALYRKYRPGTFAEVKGQEHVTDPLRQALRTGRINHAYLFSGPRGCGKTSSARILARSLNCEQGPTPDPCGECESCVALAPTGPGHLDVIEIDAASHGGVDDARDLRERAFFAPVSARYKIYIIDEAHMVTREGFNALLKLVEEPPPHLKFIFATTEPEKVIGTIKSRTHHYPFRLMPPTTLRALLEEILTSESVPFEPAALPLVVRAGAGSARDSLSILDQLLAGAEEDGITYAKAVSLLGYTDGDLLDEVVNAFAAKDGGQVFHAVNRVIEGGHDPRRFASDLLERFRDLVILANVPEAASSGLLDRPADELERLVQQAASMGPAELTRAAEVFNAGLTEMRGATSPRLLLELMCARVLLPGAAQGEAALLARLERLERGGAVAQMAARASAGAHVGVPAAPSAGAPAGLGTVSAVGAQVASGGHHGAQMASGGHHNVAAPAPAAGPAQVVAAGDAAAAATPASAHAAPDGSGGSGGGDDWPEPVRPGAAPAPSPSPAPAAPAGGAPQAAAPAGGGAPAAGGAGAVQSQWAAVLAALKQRSIVVWANVSTNAQVVGVEGNLVTLGFTQVGAMKNFTGGGKDAVVAGVLGEVLGGTWRVEAVVGGSPAPRGPARAPSAPSASPPGGAGSHGAAGSSTGPVGAQGAPGPQGVSGPQMVAQSVPAPQGGQAAGGSQGRTASHGASHEGREGQDSDQPPAGAPGRQTTDESWPDAPDDFGPGAPPSPDPTQTVSAAQHTAGAPVGVVQAGSVQTGTVQAGSVQTATVQTGAGLAAARSAAKAAAQAGPRVPAARGAAAAWPDAIPGRDKGPESDEVDPLNDADADVDAVSGMALLERELGAKVIGEIDHT